MAGARGTPQALARVWELVKDECASPAVKRASLAEADKILGLNLGDHTVFKNQAQTISTHDLPAEIQALIQNREATRKNKDFKKSDELRAQIESAGFAIKDTPEGPQISK